ncbi:Uncharacterized protein TCM_025164 [Theobroma cacao]|uniref:Uncharacterized protein n=1 Tax=Theobroma cacao TaxID=3641 RepID=A0A061EXI5_THECC|nr:Uncharacterized protein TCM_025164 [Theobroma cacao]
MKGKQRFFFISSRQKSNGQLQLPGSPSQAHPLMESLVRMSVGTEECKLRVKCGFKFTLARYFTFAILASLCFPTFAKPNRANLIIPLALI